MLHAQPLNGPLSLHPAHRSRLSPPTLVSSMLSAAQTSTLVYPSKRSKYVLSPALLLNLAAVAEHESRRTRPHPRAHGPPRLFRRPRTPAASPIPFGARLHRGDRRTSRKRVRTFKTACCVVHFVFRRCATAASERISVLLTPKNTAKHTVL